MILILGALDCEVELFKENLENRAAITWGKRKFFPGSLEGRDVIVAKSGVGKVLSAMVTQRLLDMYRPSAVIFTGLAGALNPELNIGDIVIGIDAVQYDMDVTVMNFKRGEIPFTGIKEVYSDQQLIKAAEEAAETAWGINFLKKHSIYKGRILTGDRFISRGIDDPDYFVFRNSLAGDAVEMEGAAVGLVAFSNGIPFLLIRTISDRADSNAKKDFSRIMKRASRNSFYFVSHVIKNIPEHIIK